MPRRGPRLLVLGVLAGLAAAPWPQAPALPEPAVCAPPTIAVEGAPDGVPALRRGQEVTVTGRGFVDGCGRPGGGPFPGCSGREPSAEQDPMTGVRLDLFGGRVSRRATALGTADAGTGDRLGRVRWTVEVPEGQVTGPAALQVDGPDDLSVGLGVQVVAD